MRVLTVRQPWAWAIIHGGKDVENRVRNIAGDYRGPVAIHAGLTTDTDGLNAAIVDRAWKQNHEKTPYPPAFPGKDRKRDSVYLEYGAIIGVVELVDVHSASVVGGCGWLRHDCPDHGTCREHCSTWAMGPTADGWFQHLVFTHPRSIAHPIPFKGALGLRTLPANVEAQIERQLS